MKKILIIFSIFLISGISHAGNSAELYLSKMLDAYKSLSNYEDQGRSITTYIKPNKKSHSQELKFHTKYVKNTSLYFEWLLMPTELQKQTSLLSGFEDLNKPKKNTVWKDNSGIFSKFHFEETEKYTSISSALSGATGISSGIAWMTPRFLSPEISCKPSLGANKLQILESTTNTIVIKLTHNNGSVEKMHIDKNSNLLIKFEETNELPNGTVTHQVANFNILKKG